MKLEFVKPPGKYDHIRVVPGRHSGWALSHCINCGQVRDDRATKRHLCADCKDNLELWGRACERFPVLTRGRRPL